jgi:hypothetical protein
MRNRSRICGHDDGSGATIRLGAAAVPTTTDGSEQEGESGGSGKPGQEGRTNVFEFAITPHQENEHRNGQKRAAESK